MRDTLMCIMVEKNIVNRVQFIKALRTLTGMVLKEAIVYTYAMEKPVEFEVLVMDQAIIDENVAYMVHSGATVKFKGYHAIVDTLRTCAKDALSMGEDELSSDILQVLLAYKLRRPS